MKKTYQYLAFAIGTIILPLDGTCQAIRPVSAQIGKDEITAEWALPNAKEVYRTISASIPADNPERRNEFLADIWKQKRKQIIEAMQNNPQEYSKEITAKLELLTDWNNDSPELEDAKYAVQTYIQNQNTVFFPIFSIGDKYKQQIRSVHSNFKTLKIDLPEGHNLKKLFDSFNRIVIGCPGCALTWDLIMDIMRIAGNRLVDNPEDRQALEALDNLLNVTAKKIGYSLSLAHNISGLPKTATEIVRTMRTISTQLRNEFTTKDISLLLDKLNQRTDFSVFQKPKLRQKLSQISNTHSTGISVEKLRAALLGVVNDEGKIDSLINSVNRGLTDVSNTADKQKSFDERLSAFNKENDTTKTLSSGASKKRATLEEQDRTNVKKAMQFFQQRVR